MDSLRCRRPPARSILLALCVFATALTLVAVVGWESVKRHRWPALAARSSTELLGAQSAADNDDVIDTASKARGELVNLLSFVIPAKGNYELAVGGETVETFDDSERVRLSHIALSEGAKDGIYTISLEPDDGTTRLAVAGLAKIESSGVYKMHSFVDVLLSPGSYTFHNSGPSSVSVVGRRITKQPVDDVEADEGDFDEALPQPVSSVVSKRVNGPLFRAGLAEMNGWRFSMEDAHVMAMGDGWGFFCVCDGHGGDECSRFIAGRLKAELTAKVPEDDAALTQLVLKLDREFLATKSKLDQSGSTCTFVIVKPINPGKADTKYLLRVGNIGDSRVILGRRDGTMVKGSGTDGALTTDHHPDHPSEAARIKRTGGKVVEIFGVARVNGDLAVSRAFGDSRYKAIGGPAQKDHPVVAVPELCQHECGPTDFLLLVCDGISEGDFPNAEVVKLVAKQLQEGGDRPDVCAAAAAVCRKALQRGSTDNLSCMVVLLGGGKDAPKMPNEEVQLIPGPFNAPKSPSFRKAYTAMAGHAGLTLWEALEMRYDQLCSGLQSEKLGTTALAALKLESALFGDGPPAKYKPGSKERQSWFAKWLGGTAESPGSKMKRLLKSAR